MCLFPSASAPKVPAPPEPVKDLSGVANKARSDQAKKAALLSGLPGTNKTGPMGLATNANTAVKSLLGQ